MNAQLQAAMMLRQAGLTSNMPGYGYQLAQLSAALEPSISDPPPDTTGGYDYGQNVDWNVPLPSSSAPSDNPPQWQTNANSNQPWQNNATDVPPPPYSKQPDVGIDYYGPAPYGLNQEGVPFAGGPYGNNAEGVPYAGPPGNFLDKLANSLAKLGLGGKGGVVGGGGLAGGFGTGGGGGGSAGGFSGHSLSSGFGTGIGIGRSGTEGNPWTIKFN